ncbi:toprim domain-containing protein [Chengkuizengella marina]|uniref:Toprim domain-containing protein n=1 Tax=Chengkuizengella marina TaxID=2507566 RepID=A0A6N9Q7W3_9BACL|nr:toprim domain-containing protein [Chengkuizengella marina]NBI31005.1 toprim domain-containing protein [Chengkuizengella marina]
MNDLKEIKKQIYEDGRIEEILHALECENIRCEQQGDLFVAQLPDRFGSDHTRSVQVKNTEGLQIDIRSRGVSGDIYALVSYIIYGKKSNDEFKANLSNSKQWILKACGYNADSFTPKKQHNVWLKNIRKKRAKKYTVIQENKVISENVKKQYTMNPYKGWIDEGINFEIQKIFEVGFHLNSQRVVTMVRNSKGELIGVKGRYVGKNEVTQRQQKYLYLHRMNKSLELFNLHNAIPYIKESKQVILFEGYKSVMKSWQFGYRNCVSVEGDQVSEHQVKLLKELGLGIEVIFAFDKDRTVGYIKDLAKKIKNRKISCVIDKGDILNDKDSPVDKGCDNWHNLFKDRYRLFDRFR